MLSQPLLRISDREFHWLRSLALSLALQKLEDIIGRVAGDVESCSTLRQGNGTSDDEKEMVVITSRTPSTRSEL